MKVIFNTSLINNTYPNGVNITKSAQNHNSSAYNTVLPNSKVNYAYFPNISFKSNAEMEGLIKLSPLLNCAYSDRPLLLPNTFNKLAQKVAKRPNVQSAINLLQNYTKYMYRVESKIFDLFLDAPHKNKLTFDMILQNYAPESIDRLKDKEIRVINSANSIISDLSRDTGDVVKGIRDYSINMVDDGTFKRKTPLKLIADIKGKSGEEEILRQIYRLWYRLPRSSKDYDAFIVNYADFRHDSIAKRLIAPSKATIDHVTAQSRGGEDRVANYSLSCAECNQDKGSLWLDEYIMLTPEFNIPVNMQSYLNNFIGYINRGLPMFMDKTHYPEGFREAVLKDTHGFVFLDINNLNLSKQQIKENNSPNRLKQKYIVIDK